MWITPLLLCLSLTAALTIVNDDPNYAERKKLTEELLSRTESRHMQLRPPTPTGEPLNVTVNMYIRDIYDIDEDRNRYTVQFTMRQEWVDNRLAYTPSSSDFKYFLIENVGHEGPPGVWMPDTFFREEISSFDHRLPHFNQLLRIYPDGRMMHSKRISVELHCSTLKNVKEYDCPITLASYMYPTSDVHLLWREQDPYQIWGGAATDLKGVYLKNVTTSSCTRTTLLGSWPCLDMTLTFNHHLYECPSA